jgi:hypothetical protein
MQSSEYFAVASQQVTVHPAHVVKIVGQFLGNTNDRYLQVHDSIVAPANTAVPKRQWPIAQGAQFFQSFVAGELSLAVGLFVCVSNTDGTYTQSADTMDLTVETTDPEVPTGTSYASDLNTPVNNLPVWVDGAGPKKLFAIEVDGTGLANDSWVMLCAEDLGVNSHPLLIGVWPLPIGKTYLGANKITFGKDGRDMQAVDPSNGAARNGCYIYISKFQGRVSTSAGNKAKVRAEYK